MSSSPKAPPQLASAWPYPRWIAHRGAGKLAPENTLAAIRQGAELGYRMFECDVRVSRDGVAFLQHDSSLRRTTGRKGLATHRSWPELSQLDAGTWHSPEHAGEPIASLAGVARYCLANNLCLNIEIKASARDGLASGRHIAQEASSYWRLRPDLPPPLITSFEPLALEGAREAAPDLPRGLLLSRRHRHWRKTAGKLGCIAVIPHHALINQKLMDEAHADGLKVLSYTVNEAAEATRLALLGVDGLITDEVKKFLPASWPSAEPVPTNA
ncbi:glycerophosphodiester phosphodiesterase [Hydrogenophaga sp. 5NK40-0174]|uniref:glycerophosphodiester phosphodiesterase n=1 Tax=Hydrogenophaga sp. 5NK40-0174 TaxID=3127649 RepID=UPI0031067F91